MCIICYLTKREPQACAWHITIIRACVVFSFKAATKNEKGKKRNKNETWLKITWNTIQITVFSRSYWPWRDDNGEAREMNETHPSIRIRCFVGKTRKSQLSIRSNREEWRYTPRRMKLPKCQLCVACRNCTRSYARKRWRRKVRFQRVYDCNVTKRDTTINQWSDPKHGLRRSHCKCAIYTICA